MNRCSRRQVQSEALRFDPKCHFHEFSSGGAYMPTNALARMMRHSGGQRHPRLFARSRDLPIRAAR
jgi:hypothetical protein